ncbi:integrase-like protein [Rhodovulum visakhapatnamense]|uniref:Integrase-like protein n=1 Tax=Rhodovulum visakhapatnamense TaxID=364297 RepID=A0A4R8F9B4_9RHOB|nr:integrase-like protein [Rhodovulum visakhapatnamense]
MIVAFRRHTLLPLDDCLYALQPSIPHLTRSALHRCLQRHGISRLPDVDGDKPKRQRFKRYPIGFFHMDIAELQTAEGKLYLFVAIDRTSKFAIAQLVEKADRRTAWEFLERLLEAVPYRIHTILTDNGIQFAEQPRNRNTARDPDARPRRKGDHRGSSTASSAARCEGASEAGIVMRRPFVSVMSIWALSASREGGLAPVSPDTQAISV